MFIGVFSIADDEGRVLAEPAYLRSEIFPYTSYSNGRVQVIRDAVVEKCSNVYLYVVKGVEYIALLKWTDHQKPKYPKPSKLPPPFRESSSNGEGGLPESSSTGRDGFGLGVIPLKAVSEGANV